jgi:5S rRNA maturation endonuclease (ribonuclease M5)
MDITQILSRLQGVTRNGDGWKARCPAHDDQTPSLSIMEGDDGRTLLKCHARCTTEAICAKLNLTLADLFADNGHASKRNGSPGRIVATYPYHDAAGKVLFEVVRYDPKDFKQRRPDSTAIDGWTWNTKGIKKVLFRLPETLAAIASGKFIFICEGEKDVLKMVDHGFAATCNPGGAGKWQDSFSEILRGVDVVVIADKDKAGRDHAQLVVGKLHGVAKSVRVIELPDTNGKPVKDAFDFFAAGGDAGQVFELVDKTPIWTPGQTETGEKSKIPFPEIDNAAALCADDSIILPPEIIRGVLHQGLKAVLGSNAKARKTWILLDAAISIATGTKFWKWDTQKGKVLYINFEIPRAFIRSRIKRLCEAKGIDDVSNLDVWTLRGHAAPFWRLLPALLDKIKAGNYSLVIIDPIYKGLGGRDENSAGDIGELCNELERLAVQTGAAVLYAAHFSKGNQAAKDAIDRISGSGVFGRDADSLIILTKHETPDAYAVDLILRNLPEQAGFVVKWEYPVMVEATELDPARLKQAGGRKAENSPDDLLKLLPADGLINADFLSAANEDGISKRTFYRLRKALEKAGRILLSKANNKWMPITPKTTDQK